MKETYLNPEMEIVVFSIADVIATSVSETTTEWIPRVNEWTPNSTWDAWS